MFAVVFYGTEAGGDPALEWFRQLKPEERRIVGEDLRTLQIGFPMGDGIWELRSTLPSRIARVLFLTDGRTFVVLHGFIKKSQQTPKAELETARARKRTYGRR